MIGLGATLVGLSAITLSLSAITVPAAAATALLLLLPCVAIDWVVRRRAADRASIQAVALKERALTEELDALVEHRRLGDQQLDTHLRDLLAAKADAERASAERAVAVLALAKAHRDLEQLAYAASHDLKSPLRGIGNVSDWLEEDLAGSLTAKSREHLELLRGRVLRMEALIDGIQDYVRASRAQDLREPVSLASMLDEVVALLAPAGGVVSIDIPSGMPLLDVQRFPFHQVWSNLIANALKHGAREGAAIRVAARDAGDAWEFSVSDNGPGIAEQFQQRIFGIFQTLKARDQIEGAGIGLAIVRTVVGDRGGRVWVTSEPGRGATFFFTWPKS